MVHLEGASPPIPAGWIQLRGLASIRWTTRWSSPLSKWTEICCKQFIFRAQERYLISLPLTFFFDVYFRRHWVVSLSSFIR
jgi:hypothetical protein